MSVNRALVRAHRPEGASSIFYQNRSKLSESLREKLINNVRFSCFQAHLPPNPARDRGLVHQVQRPKYPAIRVPNIFCVALWKRGSPLRILRQCAPPFLGALSVQRGQSRGWEERLLAGAAVVAAWARLPQVALGVQGSGPTAVRTRVFELLPARQQESSHWTG